MAESKLFVKREGDFRYPICFEEDFSNLAQVMREEGLADRKICIVTDSNVGPLYEAPVKKALSEVSSDISVFTFEAGEKNKNLDTVSSLYQALISNGLDRKSLLVALGGGVVHVASHADPTRYGGHGLGAGKAFGLGPRHEGSRIVAGIALDVT